MIEATEQSTTVWRLDKRLTPVLAAHGFTAVPSTFLENYNGRLKITSAEAMVIVHLLSYKWDERKPYPRLKLIADKMGLTEVSVRSHLRKLEAKGLLQRIARSGHSNAFDLQPLFQKLEEILAEPQKPTKKDVRRAYEENP